MSDETTMPTDASTPIDETEETPTEVAEATEEEAEEADAE